MKIILYTTFSVAVMTLLLGCSSGTAPMSEGGGETTGTVSQALAPQTPSYVPHMVPGNMTWAILLCYGSDQSPGNTPFYANLFLNSGAPGNVWQFWIDQSRNIISNGGPSLVLNTTVLGWFQTSKPAVQEGGSGGIVDCVQASHINPANYFNVVAYYGGLPDHNVDLGTRTTSLNFQCNQTGNCQGQVIADGDSPPAGIEHEMGHGLSLDHSYSDVNTTYCGNAFGEYGDNDDIMSFNCSVNSFNGRYATPGPNGGSPQTGPGLNMWNRWELGFVDAPDRVMFFPSNVSPTAVSGSVTLASRGHPELGLPRVLYIPASSTMMYTVEYITPDGWDSGMINPQGATSPTVEIIKHVYGDHHSYVVKSIPNGYIYDPSTYFYDSQAGVVIAPTSGTSTFSGLTVGIDVYIDLTVSQTWTSGSSTYQQLHGETSLVTWLGEDPPLGAETQGSGGPPLIGQPSDEAAFMNANAVFGGTDQNIGPPGDRSLYPCRALFHGIQLGKAYDGHWCAFPWGGHEIFENRAFQVLAAPYSTNANWVTGTGTIPSNALAAGIDGNDILYVCRGWTPNGNWSPGKTKASWGSCDVSYGGTEAWYTRYQVLTVQ